MALYRMHVQKIVVLGWSEGGIFDVIWSATGCSCKSSWKMYHINEAVKKKIITHQESFHYFTNQHCYL